MRGWVRRFVSPKLRQRGHARQHQKRPLAISAFDPASPRLRRDPATPSTWIVLWRDEPLEALLLAGLILGLAWAPLWLGGDRPFAWGVNGVWFPGLTVVYEISLLIRERKHPVAAKQILAPLILFAAVVFWISVQMSTVIPPGFAHPIWLIAGDALKTPLNAAISVNPQASALALMRLLTDASVLWLAMQLCRSPRRALILIQAVVAICAAYSLLGIVMMVFAGGALPFSDLAGGGAIRATFVNRNTFATYAGIGLVGAVALILRFYRREAPGDPALKSYRLARLIEATGQSGWTLIGAGLVILVALLGTVSRGGVLAAVLAIFTLLLMTFARSGRRDGQQIDMVIFLAVAVLGGFLLFGDKIVGRISETGLTDASRLAVCAIVIGSINDALFIGFGYGTFADIFPLYRDQSISVWGMWDMAHNTYLETLQGLGIAFGGALILALALLVWRCAWGAVQRHRDATAPIVAASVSLLIGAHAMVDFSLQIEAVALTFMAILGAGVAQSESSRRLASD